MSHVSQSQPIVHILAGDAWGGKEAQVLAQLTSEGSSRRLAQVLMFNSGRVEERFREKNIDVQVESESQNFFLLSTSCRDRLRSISPALLVAHGYKEMLVACYCSRALGIPFVTVFHGRAEPLAGFSGLKLKLYEYLGLFVSRNFASAIVCVSQALAKDLGLYGVHKVRVIYNSHTRSGLPGESKLEVFPRRPAVYMIGRLVPVKRIDLALEAFKGFLSSGAASLYIAGDGQESARLREKADALLLGDNVQFFGFREDATDLIGDCDIFLLTSDSEGVPTVMLDAIWNGIPIVSTSVGGIPEVMSLFPGYPARLVPAGNRLELVRALEDCRRPGLRESVPQARFAVLERIFSPNSVSAEYESVYAQALGAHGR